jgi:hypothetical protein
MRKALFKLMGGVAVGLAMLTLSCASISVATDYDKNADFARYRTFAFLGGHIWINGIADDNNTLVKDRIRNSVVATLTAKGLRQVTENPDVYVAYLAGARTRTEIESTGPYGAGFGPYFGVGGWWGPTYSSWWARTYDEGTLVIDLIDASTKKLVWRAYAQTEINKPISDQKMQQVTDRAFKTFPPAPKH